MTQVVFEREPGATAAGTNFAMPKPIGRMMVGLALLTLATAATVRYFGTPSPAKDLAPAIASRDLIMRDLAGGGIEIRDARDGKVLSMTPSEDSARFLRTVIRGLGSHVDRRDAVLDVPFTLSMRKDGQLTITRKGSDRVNSLNGFGLTQVATLQSILVKR